MRADLFRVENLEVRSTLYPGPGDAYPAGAFTRLFAEINADDTFTHWYQQKGHRANFDSDELRVEIDTRTFEIDINIAMFPNYETAADRVCGLVDAVGEVLADEIDIILPARFLIWGTWPLEPGIEERDIGAVLKENSLQLKDGHFALLPGAVESAAIELVGEDGDIRWMVKVAPFLPEPDHLYLSADIRFAPPDKPPQSHSDLVRTGMEYAYDFLLHKAVPFAGSFMP